MTIDYQHIAELIYRRLEGSASAGQLQELDAWVAQSPGNKDFYDLVANSESVGNWVGQQQLDQESRVSERLLTRVRTQVAATTDGMPAPVHRIHFLRTAWFRYVAVLLIVAGTATYLYRNNRLQEDTVTRLFLKQQEIKPGSNKAILTLADGSTIVLDDAANGVLARQGNTQIIQGAAGALTYNAGVAGGEVAYNTITTPKGGQYQITLPDGSTVWLNAASSIRFPTAFVRERKVAIMGEVYFEIAADKSKPFFVTAGETSTEVLGTTFNINAYKDEPVMRTTLLEGRIKVSFNGVAEVLKPGQQAIIKDNIQVDDKVKVKEAIAWKDGLFNFNGADLKTVMRQLERWYDIDVQYEGKITEQRFIGELQKNLTLSQIIATLEDVNIKFRLKGRTLIVE